MVEARTQIAERLADLYDRPVNRFLALIEYFDDEDEDTLKEAVKRHVESDTYVPTVASIKEQIRTIHEQKHIKSVKATEVSNESVPGMAAFIRPLASAAS